MRKGIVTLLITSLSIHSVYADTKDKMTLDIQQNVNELRDIDYLREKLVATALQFEGYPYTWGGSTPGTSFDCSGLIQWSYGQLGYELPRVSYQQAKEGKEVDIQDIKPGDIIAFHTSNRNGPGEVSHVALYINNNLMLHARSSKYGILVEEYSPAWKAKTVSIRRIIN